MRARQYTSRSGLTFRVIETFANTNERRTFEVCRVLELGAVEREYVLKIGGKPAGGEQGAVSAEADILRMLQSKPLIVQYVDHGALQDGRPYLRTDYVRGENLSHLREHHGSPLDPKVVLAIVRDLSDALTTAHAAHILHCDVKLANIFLDYRQGRAMLGDFHIACRIGTDETTLRPEPRGSAEVAAPEQYRSGAQRLDKTTDIYCLAVVVHDLLSSRRLFENRSFRSTGEIRQLENHDEPRFFERTQKRQLHESLQSNKRLGGQNLDAVAQLLCDCLAIERSQRRSVRSARAFYGRMAQALGLSPDPEVDTWE